MLKNTKQYSIIIPSRGDRPLALGQAIDSVIEAMHHAALKEENIEILIGFDGVKGKRVRPFASARYFDLPSNKDFGNALRHTLLKAAKGQRIIFLDDDNILTKEAFSIYETHKNADMLIARIDVSRAHDIPYLPIAEDDKPIVRPCNIDPLCLCLSRELVVVRCGGWLGHKYEADYENMLRYSRRARNMCVIEDVVGIYDAGRGIDEGGLNFRQKKINTEKG